MGPTLLKEPLPTGYMDSHLTDGSYGQPESAPNGILIGSAVFAKLTNVTNRQTDRPRYSACSNRPLSLAISAMRPKNSDNDDDDDDKLTIITAFI